VAGRGVDLVGVPVVEGTTGALDGYGHTFDDPAEVQVEIVRWPAGGWRPVDPDTGDEGGTVEGVFDAFWDGPTLRALNSAVGGEYVLAEAAGPPVDTEPWAGGFTIGHLNYHPDGGQLFFPLDPGAFVFPLVPRQRFLDRQGRVHARVSVEFADEFGCRLLIPGSI
jgi:hypothetical protein